MNDYTFSKNLLTGSQMEDCTVPPFYMNHELERTEGRTFAGRTFADVDIMVSNNCPVGFNLETEPGIRAVVETDASPPGYLRLRAVSDLTFITNGLIETYAKGQYFTYCRSPKRLDGLLRILVSSRNWVGPAINLKWRNVLVDQDLVSFYPCSKWPPTAMSWINRARPSSWPSTDAVEKIITSGCRIVLANHDDIPNQKYTEFRFSFSEVETLLFQTMSTEQRHGFVAFKALVKYRICKIKQHMSTESELKTYHLKTIFMWTCETIPCQAWQTSCGWSSCLLLLLDQLHSCLTNGILPGYFIPESNLFDKLNQTRETQAFENTFYAIQDLRSNPLLNAAEFVDSVEVFRECPRMFYTNLNELWKSSAGEQTLSDIFEDELKYLLLILSETYAIHDVQFQTKRVCFQIIANWCTKNSIDFQQDRFRQCLIERITLFDLIYLDVEHEIHFPEDILLSVYNKELFSDFNILCQLLNKYNFKRDVQSAVSSQINLDKASHLFQLWHAGYPCDTICTGLFFY